jgi:hypothetical protein
MADYWLSYTPQTYSIMRMPEADDIIRLWHVYVATDNQAQFWLSFHCQNSFSAAGVCCCMLSSTDAAQVVHHFSKTVQCQWFCHL